MKIKFDCGHEGEGSEASAKIHALRRRDSLCHDCSPKHGYQGPKTAARLHRQAVNKAARKQA